MMERFVCNPKSLSRTSFVTAVLSGVAIEFFGAPMLTLVFVGIAEMVIWILAEDRYEKKRPPD